MRRKPAKKEKRHVCGECRHAVPVHRFHTLSIDGKPTLAECPFSLDRRRLLSEEACQTHFIAF